MRALVAVALIFIAGGTVAAEWVLIGRTGTVDQYVDPGTIAKSGSTVKIWVLSNNKREPIADSFDPWSSKIQWEVDCGAGRIRALSNESYARPMGGGPPVFASAGPPGGYPWLSAPSAAVTEAVRIYTCGGS